MEPHVEKFQQLLRELFQFDCADLDFGIYRIMNHKRDAIEKFITEKLPNRVAADLDRGPLFQRAQAAEAVERAARRVRETIGLYAIDAAGQLALQWHEADVGKEYLAAQARLDDGGQTRESVETQIYNHLYTFFSRYYQDGDFISKRRYSKRERYTIPYNGEEVYLHWANSNQYYIKTAEHFQDYDWKASNGVTVRFKLQAADVEQNNVKGDKRFFLPIISNTSWEEKTSGEVFIPFEYRPLTPQEANKHGNQNQQDKIIAEAVAAIPKLLEKAARAYTALTNERRRNGNGPVSNLEHHLRQYTRRNTSDFFIHKDLKEFLSRELDFYLKNEVLNLDEMERAGEQMAEGWFQMMRLIKSAGNPIIDFLEQIENFQRMLWEKRKFVTETHYCIIVGSIAAEFYPTIAANEAQWVEWWQLFDIDGTDRSADFLDKHPTLVLDTRHFDQDFVDNLLASFDDLDGVTGGLLVHSENWQALNLLLEKYQQQVMCVYLDPPYNSKTSEILYKNNYKHSSWLSLIDNRLAISHRLSTVDGSHVIAIDENEQVFLGQLLMSRFPNHDNVCVTIVHNKKGIQGDYFSYSHDFAYFCIPSALPETNGKNIPEDEWDYVNLRKWGRESERSTAKNCFYPIFVRGDEIIGFGDVCDDDFHPEKSNVARESSDTQGEEIAVYPVDSKGVERKWRYARGSVQGITHLLQAHPTKSGEIQIRKANDERTFKTVWDDPKYIAGDYGTKWLTDLGLKVREDLYPKSVHTVEDSVHLLTDSDSLTLDYFAGSGTTGHAVINLNREDGGRRKFILVEMGEYFDTVLLPRIKKVTFTPEWKTGKPQRIATPEEVERSPRIIKYIRLESYEDALNSIEFDPVTEQLALEEKYEDYLLRYMLRWETKESETLLNVEKLTNSFQYKLHLHIGGETQVRTVDFPETFNYLLGLNVQTRRVYEDEGRRYLVHRGETRENPGCNVAVIWRETEGWEHQDFERDKQFVEEQEIAQDADKIYVNGDSFIPGSEAVERLFRERMFARVDA